MVPFFVMCLTFFFSTKPSTLTLASICSLLCLLCNKKGPRSLGCIIRKLRYKVYRYVQVESVVEEPVVEESRWSQWLKEPVLEEPVELLTK